MKVASIIVSLANKTMKTSGNKNQEKFKAY